MNPPGTDKSIKHLSETTDKSQSWLEKNICHPAWEAALSGLYEPTANAFNLLPHAITGNDWLPKIKVDNSHDEAPANTGEYLSRLLVHGAIGAFAYTVYGRLVGGLLRKGTRLAKLEGRAANFFGSESSGQIAGAAVHDALLDAPDVRSRTANVASGVASFSVFEFLNKNISKQHWLTRAIAHAPIGFAGGMTGYLTKEGVAGHELDYKVGFQSAVDGAALNVFLPAMQWTSGKALDMVADKRGTSIPLERHANYEHLKGKSPTLDTLMRLFPATRVTRSAEEGAAIDHKHDTVHVMPKSPADHLAHELAHKLALKKFERDIQYAAGLLKYNEKFAKQNYVDARVKQEQFARETQLQVAKELLFADNPRAKVPLPEPSHMMPIYQRMFEMEFDQHFKPTGGRWRPEEDFALVPLEIREKLQATKNPEQILSTLYPELTQFEQNAICKSTGNWVMENYWRTSNNKDLDYFEMLWSMPLSGWREALKWSLVERTVSSLLRPSANEYFIEEVQKHPVLADFREQLAHNKNLQRLAGLHLEVVAACRQIQDSFETSTTALELIRQAQIDTALNQLQKAEEQLTSHNELHLLHAARKRLDATTSKCWSEYWSQYELIRFKHAQEYKELQNIHNRKVELTKVALRKDINRLAQLIDPDHLATSTPHDWNPPYADVYLYQDALAAALTFGKNPTVWWNLRTDWLDVVPQYPAKLPIANKATLKSLQQLITEHYRGNTKLIGQLLNSWTALTDLERTNLSKNSPAEVLEIVTNHIYPESKNTALAKEACKWDVAEWDYQDIEARFESSHRIPNAFPADKTWSKGIYTGHFLDRTDPLALFLGHYTNSCIHLNGANKEGMWWSQESPIAGFFVVKDAEGDIVAASRAWKVPEVNGICFNNVEAKGLGNRHQLVLDIYKQAAQHMVSEHGLDIVSVGTNSGELDTSTLPTAKEPLPLPAGQLGHNDCSNSQRILAQK